MKIYITVLASLVALDSLWLVVVAKSFYQKNLGYIFADKFVLWPVVIFYAVYAFGTMYFVVIPALEAKSLSIAIFRGALLGLLAYGAYDFTNQATLAKWPVAVTVVDLLWGVALTAGVSVVGYLIFSKI